MKVKVNTKVNVRDKNRLREGLRLGQSYGLSKSLEEVRGEKHWKLKGFEKVEHNYVKGDGATKKGSQHLSKVNETQSNRLFITRHG